MTKLIVKKVRQLLAVKDLTASVGSPIGAAANICLVLSTCKYYQQDYIKIFLEDILIFLISN